jgi:hypothetical protein
MFGARLEQARHHDGTIAEGAPGWTLPQRPLLTVVTALRDDPLGRMFARRQIDQPQFRAGREYQGLIDAVEVPGLRSVDLEKTKIDGARFGEPFSDRQRRLAAQLRKVDQTLTGRFGSEGLTVSRGVLSDRKSLEQVAKEHGAESTRCSVGWLAIPPLPRRSRAATRLHCLDARSGAAAP